MKRIYCVVDYISSIEIMLIEDSFYLTSGTTVSWDTSYVKKASSYCLVIQKSSNNGKIMIISGVYEELKTHLENGENYKYEIIKSIIDNDGFFSLSIN